MLLFKQLIGGHYMAFIREKVKKGIPYYYIVESYREGSKVRQRILEYIGPFDALKSLALSGYNAKQEDCSQPTIDYGSLSFKTYEHGAVMGMYWASQVIEIEKICEEVFGQVTIKNLSRGRILLLAMIQRAVCPGSKREFETWSANTSLPYHLKFNPADLTSQTFWEAMDSITEDQIQTAWNRIVNKYMEISGIAPAKMHLDYTNYHTFINTRNGRCIICKRGHNKQKRDDLRQFSLAVLTSKILTIPLAWHMYAGNENDKQEFSVFTSYIREQMKELGINPSEATVTFDGGSNSTDNFKNLGFHFVCAHSLTSHKELYEIDISDYEMVTLHNGSERLAYNIQELEFSGVHGKGVLVFSQELKDGQMAQLERDLEYARSQVTQLQEKLKNPKSRLYTKLKNMRMETEKEIVIVQKYNEAIDQEAKAREEEGRKKKGRKKNYKAVPVWDNVCAMKTILEAQIYSKAKYIRSFTSVEIKEVQEGIFSFDLVENEKEKEAYCRRNFGKKLICTDQTTWTMQEIIEEYTDQECIENGIFRTTKDTDHFSVRPQYHWTDQKIRVHLFICLGALVIGDVLNKHLRDNNIIYTKSAMLDRLGEIHDGWLFENDKAVKREIERMDSVHQQLWDCVLKLKDSTKR